MGCKGKSSCNHGDNGQERKAGVSKDCAGPFASCLRSHREKSWKEKDLFLITFTVNLFLHWDVTLQRNQVDLQSLKGLQNELLEVTLDVG